METVSIIWILFSIQMENVSIIWILNPIQMETVSIIWILYPIVSKPFPKNGNGFQMSWILFLKDGNIWKYFMKERMYPKWINVQVLTGGLCCVIPMNVSFFSRRSVFAFQNSCHGSTGFH